MSPPTPTYGAVANGSPANAAAPAGLPPSPSGHPDGAGLAPNPFEPTVAMSGPVAPPIPPAPQLLPGGAAAAVGGPSPFSITVASPNAAGQPMSRPGSESTIKKQGM